MEQLINKIVRNIKWDVNESKRIKLSGNLMEELYLLYFIVRFRVVCSNKPQ